MMNNLKRNAIIISIDSSLSKQTNKGWMRMMMDKTNELLEELLAMIARSNKILMMVNIVNIATIITIITVLIWLK
jgi:hypothetical protein